ncbi:MAG: FAD-dependent oxidoreductase [Spirochaetaceae bacterium]|nr:MAG: FAD-dependent oxidoreductase [Spirochaetaceae bacterium]
MARDARRLRGVVIGGGGTGLAVAYDLANRGFDVTLFERGELTSGTTGRHHGQLHSGARYAVHDVEIARECMRETRILRRISPGAIERNYGVFVGIGDDAEYLPEFRDACADAGIPTEEVSPRYARTIEPNLTEKVSAAVLVPDGTIDAWRLALEFAAAAVGHGAEIRTYSPVVAIEHRDGSVMGVRVRINEAREEFFAADFVVNAAGAWAGRIAAMADLPLEVTPAPGTMVAVKGRLTNMVVSRLQPPGDGDIVVPQRKLSIIGSTQSLTDDPDNVVATDEEIEFLIRKGALLVPGLADAELHAAWSAVRPLYGANGADGRSLSRGFRCIDHAADGVAGLFSVVGGKATVLRAMAEDVTDEICRYCAVDVPCRTADTPLPGHREYYHGEAAGERFRTGSHT